MSDSSNLGSFVAKHKVAILATLGVTVTAASTYYYLQAQQSSATSKPSADSPSKKSKKKKSKKKHSADANEKSPAAATDAPTEKAYPIDSNGDPSLTQELINSLSEDDKNKIGLALKEDGNDFFKNKNFEKAIKFYTEALKLSQDPVYYSNRSACYVGLEDYEKVVEDTTSALKLKPDYTKCLLRRSNAYEQLGNYEESMYDLTALTLFGGFNNKSIEAILDRVLKKHSSQIVEKNLPKHQNELPSASSISSFFGAFETEWDSIEGLKKDEENTADYYLYQGLKQLDERNYESFEKADSYFTQAVANYELTYKIDESIKEKYAIALEYSGAFKFLKNDPLNSTMINDKDIQEDNEEKEEEIINKFKIYDRNEEMDIIGLTRKRKSLLWLILSIKNIDPVIKPIEFELIIKLIQQEQEQENKSVNGNKYELSKLSWINRDDCILHKFNNLINS